MFSVKVWNLDQPAWRMLGQSRLLTDFFTDVFSPFLYGLVNFDNNLVVGSNYQLQPRKQIWLTPLIVLRLNLLAGRWVLIASTTTLWGALTTFGKRMLVSCKENSRQLEIPWMLGRSASHLSASSQLKRNQFNSLGNLCFPLCTLGPTIGRLAWCDAGVWWWLKTGLNLNFVLVSLVGSVAYFWPKLNQICVSFTNFQPFLVKSRIRQSNPM